MSGAWAPGDAIKSTHEPWPIQRAERRVSFIDPLLRPNSEPENRTICLQALQPGNTLVVWKLDRLGRDLKHLVGLVDTLNQHEVGLKVLASAGAQIDTITANGRLGFGIFAAWAEDHAK